MPGPPDPALRRRARSWRDRRPAPPRPFVAWACRITLRALSVLPLRLLHGIGAMLGTVAAFLPVKPRRTTATNVQLAYRDLDRTARRTLVRHSLAQTGRGILELAAVWGWTANRTLSLVASTTGESCFADAAAEGRGVIVVSLHLGSWELGLLYAARHYDTVTLYRPPRIRELEPFIVAARQRAGGTMMPTGLAGTRAAIRALTHAGVVVLVADHDPGSGAGVFVPFFGVLANTTTLVSRLARRTGATVVIAWSEREPAGRGARIHFAPAGAGVYDADPARAAAALNLEIESVIRTRPEQYVWSYKRFRIRPAGHADLYRSVEGLRQAMEPPRAR